MWHQWLWLISIVVLVGCVGCAAPEPATPAGTVAVASAHDFTLLSIDNETYQLSQLQGEWVLVNFWATWCAPCVEEMPYLQQVADEREITVLGVNMRESAEAVAAFSAEHKIRFPLLLDPDDDTVIAYNTISLPVTAVVAPDGTIALQQFGPLEPDVFGAWLDEAGVSSP